MFNVFVKSALRHAASGIGAALVAKGVIGSGQETAFVEISTGAVLYGATQVTSWLNAKKQQENSIY
jgi:hypothetical protein